jgi:HSP20 family protein
MTGGAAQNLAPVQPDRKEFVMYRSLFARDAFAELERLQREIQEAFDLSPSIRGIGRGGFPALNVGGTSEAIEIYAFAPGLDPAAMEVNLDRGLLTIAGERAPDLPSGDDGQAAVHINERFSGRFRRVVSLSDDLDPNSVSADYHDGVLHIHIKRHESAQSRRINVQ